MAIKISGTLVINDSREWDLDFLPSSTGIDLGQSGQKWRSLYLSGGIYANAPFNINVVSGEEADVQYSSGAVGDVGVTEWQVGTGWDGATGGISSFFWYANTDNVGTGLMDLQKDGTLGVAGNITSPTITALENADAAEATARAAADAVITTAFGNADAVITTAFGNADALVTIAYVNAISASATTIFNNYTDAIEVEVLSRVAADQLEQQARFQADSDLNVAFIQADTATTTWIGELHTLNSAQHAGMQEDITALEARVTALES